jgi:hypothetical protein
LGKSELEKENVELKEPYCLRRCKHCEFLHENGNCLKVGGYFTAVDNKNCPILKDKVDLIKENAELKEKLKPENCLRYLAKGGYVEFFCENVNEHKQLTKARCIIASFVKANTVPDLINIKAEAEQFLNSEVEK